MVQGLYGLMSDVFQLQLFPCLSLCTNQLHSVLSCILPPPLFFSAHSGFPSFSPKASLSPDRLAGDKTWSLGEERDIWEQDGKGDGGHVPTWSPSSGSVETIVTRRWVIFSASSCAAPVDHHVQVLWQARHNLQQLTAPSIGYWLPKASSDTVMALTIRKTSLSVESKFLL